MQRRLCCNLLSLLAIRTRTRHGLFLRTTGNTLQDECWHRVLELRECTEEHTTGLLHLAYTQVNASLGAYVSFVIFARLDARGEHNAKRMSTIAIATLLISLGCWSSQRKSPSINHATLYLVSLKQILSSIRDTRHTAFWGQCIDIPSSRSWICRAIFPIAVYDHLRGVHHNGCKIRFKSLDMYFVCISNWVIRYVRSAFQVCLGILI